MNNKTTTIILLAAIAASSLASKDVHELGNDQLLDTAGTTFTDNSEGIIHRVDTDVPSHSSLRGLRHRQRIHSREGTAGCSLSLIDFATAGDGSQIKHGDYVKDEWLASFGMTVEAASIKGGYTPGGKARIFDTSHTPSEDLDLNSPNKNCPTPGLGIGAGGEQGKPGANCNPKGEGNILIIQESKKDAPDDNAYGGSISFIFDPPREVTKIGLMDLDAVESSYFMIDKVDGSSVKKAFKGLGDNSIQEETIGMEDVRRITLVVSNSVGVRYVEFCGDVPLPTRANLPVTTTSASTQASLPTSPSIYFESAAWADPTHPCSGPNECGRNRFSGTSLYDDFWLSHRFEVVEPFGLVVTSVGGTFMNFDDDVAITDMFAAISRLDSDTAYPNFKDWRSGPAQCGLASDLVAASTFDLAAGTDPRDPGSREIMVPITAKLEQGWYALTFGKNMLGLEPAESRPTQITLVMPYLETDLTPLQYTFAHVPSAGINFELTHHDSQGRRELFMVKGWTPPGSCSMDIDLVDATGSSEIGGWLCSPTRILGLDWFYRSNGSYNMSFAARLGSDCQGIRSVLLEYTSEDGMNGHTQCENVAPYTLFGDDTKGNVFTFTPTISRKRIVATAFTGTKCKPELAVDMQHMDFLVRWEISDYLELFLIDADSNGVYCELTGSSTINLGIISKELAIEARFKHNFDPADHGVGLKFLLDGQDSPLQTNPPYSLDISNIGRTDTAPNGYLPLPPHMLEITVEEVKRGTEFFRGRFFLYAISDTRMGGAPACSNKD